MDVYSRVFHCCVMGVYWRVFHCCVMGVYILRDVPLLRDGCVLTGVPLLCDGCVYTHGCSTVVGWVCIYSRVFRCCGMGVYIVTGVPLLRDRDVYTHGCSTALGWVCIKSYIYIYTHGCSTALGWVCTCHTEQPWTPPVFQTRTLHTWRPVPWQPSTRKQCSVKPVQPLLFVLMFFSAVHTSTTTKTWVAYGNSHLVCV